MENNTQPVMYTDEQLMSRLKFFIGICLSLTLFGIVFVVLYSLIFVTQPLNAISPIDQKFFELIIPIATFLTGTLSGIMLASPGDKEAQKQALTAANAGWSAAPKTSSPQSAPVSSMMPSMGARIEPSLSPRPMMTPSAAPASVAVSSTGKPMPIQPPDDEL